VEREREKRVYMQERRRRRGGNEGDAAGRNNTVNNIFHPALFPRARPEEYIHIPPLSLSLIPLACPRCCPKNIPGDK
jgi:hypothetical protein